jgi:hypothetical protein
MRKSFSGDRDTAFTFIGAGNAQLEIMKNMMRLGGLQQMMRTVEYPDGTIIQLASIFGQDFVSIHSPVIPIAPEDAVAEVEVVNEYNPAAIAAALDQTFTDLVHVTGNGSVELTKVQAPEIIVVGYCTQNGSYDNRLAFKFSSLGGLTKLGIGSGGYASEAHGISANGRYIVGCTSGKTTQSGPTMASYGALLSGNDAAYQASVVTLAYSTNHACAFPGGSYFYTLGTTIQWSVAYTATAGGTFQGQLRSTSTGNSGFQSILGLFPTPISNGPTAGGPTSMSGAAIANVNRQAAYTYGGVLYPIGAFSGYQYSTAMALTVIPRDNISSTIFFNG